jgi:hypothetical protein
VWRLSTMLGSCCTSSKLWKTLMHVFKHPKYYEEYRKRAKLAQKELKASQEKKAISPNQSTDRGGRAPTVKSDKPQAEASSKATSHKPQAKASSHKPKHLA